MVMNRLVASKRRRHKWYFAMSRLRETWTRRMEEGCAPPSRQRELYLIDAHRRRLAAEHRLLVRTDGQLSIDGKDDRECGRIVGRLQRSVRTEREGLRKYRRMVAHSTANWHFLRARSGTVIGPDDILLAEDPVI